MNYKKIFFSDKIIFYIILAIILLKEDDFVICGEETDFAIVPYNKITYQLQDENPENDDFAAIIAVLEETPPNCIIVKIDSSKCLEVLQFLSHKSGVRNFRFFNFSLSQNFNVRLNFRFFENF